jgi:hypothetical protein
VDERFAELKIAQAIEPPKPRRVVIKPFEESEIKALLNAAMASQRLLMLQFSPGLFHSAETALYEMRSRF